MANHDPPSKDALALAVGLWTQILQALGDPDDPEGWHYLFEVPLVYSLLKQALNETPELEPDIARVWAEVGMVEERYGVVPLPFPSKREEPGDG